MTPTSKMNSMQEPAILIKINKTFRDGMSAQDLYEATRKSWVVQPSSTRARRARYGFSVAFGTVRQIYSIKDWYPSEGLPGRWAFRGEIAPEMSDFIGESVADLFPKGAANPIRYLNCS